MSVLALAENVTRAIINIGSNLKPLLPPDDERVASIAFEPIVHAQIPPHPRLYVVPAAVSDVAGLSMMGVFNKDGESSSLSQPAQSARWNRGKHRQPERIVPLVSMSTVLSSVPERIQIWLLMTDMQGQDFRALRSASPTLRRVHYLITETWLHNVSSYRGVANSYCDDLLPLMLVLRFEPVAIVPTFGKSMRKGEGARWRAGQGVAGARQYCQAHSGRRQTNGADEADAHWRRDDTDLPRPVIKNTVPRAQVTNF